MSVAFDNYLNEQLADPEVKRSYERRLANLQNFMELMRGLDRAREAQHLSKKDVADRMGRHPSAVSRLLCGDGPNPTLETITELAEALDLEVSISVRKRPRSSAASLRVKVAA